MIKRLTFLATLAVATTFATDAWAQAAALGFAGYTQTSGTVSYTDLGGSVRLSSTSTGVFALDAGNAPMFLQPSVITPPGGVYVGAKLTLTAESSSTVVPPSGMLPTSQNGFEGMFTITDSTGTITLLKGVFNGGILSQETSGRAAFEAADANGMVTYSSDIFQELFNEGFIYGLTGGITTLPVSMTTGFYEDFSANRIDGGFSALVIPEPASLAMAGLGVLALPVALRVARRRKAGTQA